MQNYTEKPVGQAKGEIGVARETHIQGQMNRLEKTSMALASLLDDLAEHLKPVLRSFDPEPKDENKPETELVPLAANIREVSRKIDSIASYVRSLSDRLEL